MPGPARRRCGGTSRSAVSDRQPSGNVGATAAGHFQSGDSGGFRGKGRYTGEAEDAVPADVRGYQGGESRGADAVEGRKRLAALYWRGQLPESQRGPAGARCERRKTGAAAQPGSGDEREVQGIRGGISAEVLAGALR